MVGCISRPAVANRRIRTMSGSHLIDTVNATNAAFAGRDIYGGVHQTFQAVTRPVADFVLDFDLDVAHRFVGRDAVFEQLAAFAAGHSSGYFETVADAGLGKTALAIEI